jgi:glycosyltransferase involved in cell wall biosynthesis
MRDVPRPDLLALPRQKVCVAVPCFRHAAFLETMFLSLIRQTRIPDEVFLVVDDSPDDTALVLSRLVAGAAPPLRDRCRILVNRQNIGQAASLNRAIAETTSDVVMVLNDDDYLMHDAVEVALHLLVRHPDLALIGAGSVHFRGEAELESATKGILERSGGSLPMLSVSRPADVLTYRQYNDLNMTHSGCAFMKAVWSTVRGYEPDPRRRLVPFSDRDFQLRVNALFPVGVSYDVPFSFWRADSSVDHGVNS